MPYTVIAAIIANVVSSMFASMIVGKIIGAIVAYVVMGLISSATGGNKKNAGQSDPVTSSQGRTVTVRQPISAWQVVYGEARVGGSITHVQTVGDELHMVVTLSGHVCDRVQDVYFNDELVVFNPTTHLSIGRFGNHARVQRSLGAETGQPFPDLVARSGGKWPEGARQTGRTKIYVMLGANPNLFPSGIPNISTVVRGRKVYDPRTGASAWTNNAALCVNDYLTSSSFGVGAVYAEEIDEATLIAAANVCDERVMLAGGTATFTASADTDALTLAENTKRPAIREGVRVSTTGTLPAPLAADTTYYAVHADDGRLKLASSDANALAGTVIDLTDAGEGEHTLTYYDEPRYTAGGAFQVNTEPKRVLGLLLATMAGKAVNVGGKWMLFAGAHEAPTITLDEDDLMGSLKVQTLVSRRESANGVKGLFTDPNQHWQPTSFPAVASDAYMNEDGERVWKDIDVTAFVTAGTQAQRLAKIELLSLRQGLTVEGAFKLTAWQSQTGRTVALSIAAYGWSSKPFEVTGSRFIVGDDGTLGVQLTLRETAEAVFDWSTSEEQTVDVAPNTDFAPIGTIGAPGAPLVVEELYETRDGRGVGTKAIVSWAASDYPYGPTYELQYKRAADSVYTVLPLTRGLELEVMDLECVSFDFRVRAYSVTGSTSDFSPTTRKEILGLGEPPAVPVIRGLQTMGGFAVLSLDPHEDLDVRRGGRWRVRHCEDTGAPTWEASFSIGEGQGYVGDQTVLVLPLKPGTYLVRAEDAVGVLSEDFASISTKQASAHAFSTLSTVQEDTAFSGTHANTVVADGLLKLSGTGDFDSIPDLDEVSSVDGFGGIELEGTYTFSGGLDLGAVANVRLTGKIEGITVNVNDRIDDRSAPIDDWLDFDGTAGGGSADAWLEVRETDDDPAGAPVWSEWKRLDASEFSARGFEFRLQMVTDDPAYNLHISALRVTAAEVA